MTAMILRFIGRAESSSRDNLEQLIEHAKRSRFFVGRNALDWHANTWDFRPFFAKAGRNPPGMIAHFTTLETTRRGNRAPDAKDFSQPFLDASKALLIEFLNTTRDKSPCNFVGVIRITEKAFRDLGEKPDICMLSGKVLDHAEQIIRANYKVPWKYARLLERIAQELVNPARLVPVPLLWKTSVQYTQPKRNDRVNKVGGVAGNTNKLPHLKAILDLAGVFHSSQAPEDIVITSWFALAMFAPERVNEILTLSIDCETEMDGAYGLSWRPLKGGQAKTNFAASDDWGPVAHEAIQRLVRLGEKARAAAKWYEENPRQLYLPPNLEHLRGKPITIWEASQILGRSKPLNISSRPRNALDGCGTTRDTSRGAPGNTGGYAKLFTFESLENYVLSELPAGWPYIDQRTRLKASESLFCLPAEILRSKAETEWYIPTFITYSQIKHDLGSKPTGKTIFARHDLIDPSTGRPWKLNTHQPRHLLNTLAQSKHVSQELIAFWSGRKSSRQNDYYNHMPQDYYLEAWQRLDERTSNDIKVIGPLNDKIEERSRKELISRDDALRLELGSTISTRFGLCRHDYSLTPCPKDKDCIRCGENTFIKGQPEHLAEARSQLALHTRALAHVHSAIADGDYGAEDWLKRHTEKAERWQLAVDQLTDAEIQDGTLISLPPVANPQSKSGLAIALRESSAPERNPAKSEQLDLKIFDDMWLRGDSKR